MGDKEEMDEGAEIDMTRAMEELVSSFVDMDGDSRVMFMKLLLAKMNDKEMDSILEVINERYTVDNGESDDNGVNSFTVEMEEGAAKNKSQQDENENGLNCFTVQMEKEAAKNKSQQDNNDDVLKCLSIEMEEDTAKSKPQEEDNEAITEEHMDSFYLSYQEPKHETKELKLEPQTRQEYKTKESQTIEKILENVAKLTTADKLLLYLKLPNIRSNNNDSFIEPQESSCLESSHGSNAETILWIKNNLQEDPRNILAKQEVYDEYYLHCKTYSTKPLSTTDFGKMMKQVFPQIQKRRLGIRGKSRYCYAGVGRIMHMPGAVPLDINHDLKLWSENSDSSGTSGTNDKTIVWIKNHIQEDPLNSLPKQEVYDEYALYCQTYSIEPLSTSDFGKMIKQVFPQVYKRRLGIRGKSTYCYAGLGRILVPGAVSGFTLWSENINLKQEFDQFQVQQEKMDGRGGKLSKIDHSDIKMEDVD